jgi:hypothetical protein
MPVWWRAWTILRADFEGSLSINLGIVGRGFASRHLSDCGGVTIWGRVQHPLLKKKVPCEGDSEAVVRWATWSAQVDPMAESDWPELLGSSSAQMKVLSKPRGAVGYV